MARLRTLLVDDAEDLRALLRFLMERDGRFDIVAEANNGEEAIALAEIHVPDLVVLDLAMPVMDGLTALPGLRAVAPDVRVVVLSGFPADDMGPVTAAAGAVGYLEKGRNIPTLAADIHELAGVLRVVRAVLEHELPPDVRSAGAARTAVAAALGTEVAESTLDTLVLLTSELVTNVVAHARTSCHLGVELFPDLVRVSVSDTSTTPLMPQTPNASAESGRGLSLVETLSLNWGVITSTHGKTVWFDVPRQS
jgi:DNA-binding NarL/FixJ family response regulator